MEIVNIQKTKNVTINTGKNEIHISCIVKTRLKIKNKEIEIEESIWKDLPFEYNSNDALRNLELIEYTMNVFEKKTDEVIENIKKVFANLEQILEKYGYQII